MSLLLPLGLLGLLTLPIILLLHLLRHRREPLPISSLRLWRGLQQKRQGVRPRTIPLSLMLLLQLLIAAVLTFGLAQPVFSFLRNRPQHTIYILDTTTSMAAEDASAPNSNRRFDAARELIRMRLQALGENDTFAIVNLNRRPQVIAAGDSETVPQALQQLDNLIPGATGIDLPAALTLANGLIEAERYNQIVVLSDNNYTVEAEDLPNVFAPIDWQTLGNGADSANQALVNVSARTLADKRYRLFARVVNYSDAAVDRSLRLSVDGQVSDSVDLQLGPAGETIRVWTLSASAQTAVVEIVEPDVLPMDNRAELLLANTSRFRLLLVFDSPQEPIEAEAEQAEDDAALLRALEAQPGVDVTTVSSTEMSRESFAEFDLIIFDGLPLNLAEWPAGNLLVINPPLGHPLLSVENFARDLRPNLETISPLLAGIDLSGVYFSRIPDITLPDWAEADLMAVTVSDEEGINADPNQAYPLIFHGAVGNSRIVVWAFDLAESNLPARLALPLLTGNTLSTLLSTTVPAVIPLGEAIAIDPEATVELPDGQRLSQPFQGSKQSSQFTRTEQLGLYKLYDKRNNLVGGFATHAGSVLESNLAPRFDPGLVVSVDTGAGDASPEIEYDEYWPWLAGLALVIITLEGWFAWQR